jgi:uncharacterized membrane protein YphA (DoxX/SURF4 family)
MNLREFYNASDRAITRWMGRHGLTLLRVSLGVLFLWFGLLKFFPDLPLPQSEELGVRTMQQLSFGLVSAPAAANTLAVLECVIGLGLLIGRFLRTVIFLLVGQMVGTFTPMVLFPAEVFTHAPYAPTMLGMYIIKNVVLVSAAIVIGSTVRGARIRQDFETTFIQK